MLARIRIGRTDEGEQMKGLWIAISSTTLLLICFGFTSTQNRALGAQGPAQSADPTSACDRTCLNGLVNEYLLAMVAHDPSRLRTTSSVRFTENNVELKLGDGLWGTIGSLGSYKLYFDDPEKGQVGFYGVVLEDGHPAAYSLRMRIENRQIAEIETIVVRKVFVPFANPAALVEKPVFSEDIPLAKRPSREDLIRAANGYFDTLQQNDGTLKVAFDAECNRVEDGVQTTNNPELGKGQSPGNLIFRLGCADQFRTGFFHFVTRIRDRRVLVVDQQRGLVFASAFFDHEGRMRTVRLTDGQEVAAEFYVPWTWQIGELFKLQDGKLRQIEALVLTAPYNVPSLWATWGK
jgi:hypothetical protein